MKKVLGLVFGVLYLLSSSIFFHASAMNIVMDHPGPCDSTMKHHDSTESTRDSSESDCFEKCFGSYDEFLCSYITVKAKSFDSYEFNNNFEYLVDTDKVDFEVLKYRQFLDGGGKQYHQFSDTYIAITKKLE